MRAKTMEGLIGARTNMELMNTPFRVFKEARRKGDVAKMKRAMGYMNECQEDANEYKAIADDGMKEDAEDTRKIAEKQREEMIKNRREEREEQQKKLEAEREENKADKNKIVDTAEISEEGKVLLKENTTTESSVADGTETDGTNPDDGTNGKPKVDFDPVFYSSAGTVEQSEDTGVKVSASI